MKILIEDIKNKSFKRVYLLYGVEAYLKKLYKQKLREAMIDQEDTMNVTVFEGKNIVIKDIIAQADTMPFFAEKRLVLVERSGLFKKAAGELPDYMGSIPEETCLVFVEDEIDKRGKLYKAVKKYGRVVEMGRQDEKTLMNWVLQTLRKEKKNITSATMELFLAKTGNDMELIKNELEKLLCYTLGKDTITSEDVDMICANQTENKIFEMINAIAKKQQKHALSLYYDLLALKEAPMRILFLITRQFHLLKQVKELKLQGFDQKRIAAEMGMQSFIIRNYMGQIEYFTLDKLKEAVLECIETEEAVKSGRMKDTISVELLIVKYSV